MGAPMSRQSAGHFLFCGVGTGTAPDKTTPVGRGLAPAARPVARYAPAGDHKGRPYGGIAPRRAGLGPAPADTVSLPFVGAALVVALPLLIPERG